MSDTDSIRETKRPNILIFITDQQRADHLGCAGNSVIQTPHLDALAHQGVRFERAYVANPLCQPARATLFTGLTPRGHGVRTNGIPLSPSLPTVPDALRQNGYRTHAVGKLHLRNYGPSLDEPSGPTTDPAQMDRFSEDRQRWLSGQIAALPPNYAGFETTDFTGAHGPGIFGDYLNWLRDQDPNGPTLLTREAGTPPASEAEQSWTMRLPAELHYNTWVADRTIDFLRHHSSNPAESDRPFFLWCSFPDPHHPYCPPLPWAERYSADDVPLPNRREGELDDLPPHYRVTYEKGDLLSGRKGPTKIRDDQMRDIIALTYGMVSMVDQQVGRVVTEIERLGLRENTIILFLSDHGDMMGDHWMLNKGPFHFNGLLRVPMIWSWPGHFSEGVVSPPIISHLDVAPTLLDLAGVAIPEGIVAREPEAPAQLPPWPGHSLQLLLRGRTEAVRSRVLVENDEDYLGLRLRTLITERYHMTVYAGQPYGELFDLVEDPRQLHNLWNRAGYQNLKRELQEQLLEEIILTDSPLPRRTAHA